MAHPHKDVIANMDASSLVCIIEDSKKSYVLENLSVNLHERQVQLLKQVEKHEKPHHKKIRIKKFQNAEKDDLFNMHLELSLKKYKKLARKGLIEVDLNPKKGLACDCSLTSEGVEVLNEISRLESEWEKVVSIKDSDLEVLKDIALNSFGISYRYKKKKGFIF